MKRYEVKLSPAVASSETIRALIDRAGPVLESVLADAPEPVTAEWDVADAGPGRTVLVLRLSDPVGSASAAIPPDELADLDRAEGRFLRLCSAMLRNGSGILLQRLATQTGVGE